ALRLREHLNPHNPCNNDQFTLSLTSSHTISVFSISSLKVFLLSWIPATTDWGSQPEPEWTAMMKLKIVALEAANASQAPYSGSPSKVALVDCDRK
ncbi:hypothetical protein HN51_040316, partial [Arachis hypogaea]